MFIDRQGIRGEQLNQQTTMNLYSNWRFIIQSSFLWSKLWIFSIRREYRFPRKYCLLMEFPLDPHGYELIKESSLSLFIFLRLKLLQNRRNFREKIPNWLWNHFLSSDWSVRKQLFNNLCKKFSFRSLFPFLFLHSFFFGLLHLVYLCLFQNWIAEIIVRTWSFRKSKRKSNLMMNSIWLFLTLTVQSISSSECLIRIRSGKRTKQYIFKIHMNF